MTQFWPEGNTRRAPVSLVTGWSESWMASFVFPRRGARMVSGGHRSENRRPLQERHGTFQEPVASQPTVRLLESLTRT